MLRGAGYRVRDGRGPGCRRLPDPRPARRRIAPAGMILPAVAAALLVAVAVPAAAQQRQVPEARQEIQLSFAPLVKRVAPAVVNIYSRRKVEQVVRSPLFDDPFFRQFFGDGFGGFGPRRQPTTSLGSGVVVAPGGLIVTNAHVIEGAVEITVALSDRREFAAELVLTDERTDLAVLRIADGGAPLPALELADSDRLEVGDLVLAIGNPFNVGQTVTSGIVSAVARTGVEGRQPRYYIQTDAAINPGNSGGALVTVDGRLAGINTAIFSQSGGSHGIGFAVPSNVVRTVVDSARAGAAHVVRPWLGLATQEVGPEIADSLGLVRPVGALVRGLHPAGPAAAAGLRVGDVILSVEDVEVPDPVALDYRLTNRPIGETVRIGVLRDGRRQEARLDLRRAPEVPAADETVLRGEHPLVGVAVANLSPALAEAMGLDTLLQGVTVTAVDPRSPARRLRIDRGDVVRRVNGRDIASVDVLVEVLRQATRQWDIAIERGGRVVNLTVRG